MIDQHHEPKPGAAAAVMSELHVPGFKEQMLANLRRNFVIYNRAPEYNITRAAITLLVRRCAAAGRQYGSPAKLVWLLPRKLGMRYAKRGRSGRVAGGRHHSSGMDCGSGHADKDEQARMRERGQACCACRAGAPGPVPGLQQRPCIDARPHLLGPSQVGFAFGTMFWRLGDNRWAGLQTPWRRSLADGLPGAVRRAPAQWSSLQSLQNPSPLFVIPTRSAAKDRLE